MKTAAKENLTQPASNSKPDGTIRKSTKKHKKKTKMHKKLKASDVTFMGVLHECKFCSKFFPTDERLVEHLEQAHSAEIGNEERQSKSSQRNAHHYLNVKQYSETAGAEVGVDLSSSIASQSDSLNDDLKCNSCHVYFTTEEKLKDHIEMHLCEAVATCPCCATEVRTPNPHVRSVETQTQKFYNCDDCNGQFDKQKELTWHRLEEHGIVPGPVHVGGVRKPPGRPRIPETELTCQTCSKVFKSLKVLKNHQKRHAVDENGHERTKTEDKFLCKDCGVASPDEEAHKHHLAVNHQTYACSECGKLFTSLISLEAHFRWHDRYNEEKPSEPAVKQERKWICDVCGQTYGRKSHLTVHLKRHAGIKSYSCEHCEKKFYTSHNLKIHLWTHTGEKPYICTQEGCMKRFTQKSHLTYHIRTHKKTQGKGEAKTTKEQPQSEVINIIQAHYQEEEEVVVATTSHTDLSGHGGHEACPQEVKYEEVHTQDVNEESKTSEYTQPASIFITEIHSYSEQVIGGGMSRHSILLREQSENLPSVGETVALETSSKLVKN